MTIVAADLAATVVAVVNIYLLLRGAPSSWTRRNAALDEVLRRGGEYHERQQVVGIADSDWSVKVSPPVVSHTDDRHASEDTITGG